jgi:hypothetical protein
MEENSNSNFVIVPIKRGFLEIEKLYHAIVPLGGMICGGYARYCASPRWQPDPASDVDIYCSEKEVFEEIRKFFLDKLEIRHTNDMAITYTHPKDGDYYFAPPIQLIKPIKEGAIVAKGRMEDILQNFDFSVIRAAIKSPTEVMVDKDFLEDEKHKRLVLKNIHCPISSTLRCMKYSRKGYWLRPFGVLKLLQDWENRSDSYRNKITEMLYRSKNDPKNGLTKEEVEELEALMRID